VNNDITEKDRRREGAQREKIEGKEDYCKGEKKGDDLLGGGRGRNEGEDVRIWGGVEGEEQGATRAFWFERHAKFMVSLFYNFRKKREIADV